MVVRVKQPILLLMSPRLLLENWNIYDIKDTGCAAVHIPRLPWRHSFVVSTAYGPYPRTGLPIRPQFSACNTTAHRHT